MAFQDLHLEHPHLLFTGLHLLNQEQKPIMLNIQRGDLLLHLLNRNF
jgi:hypothetical protein